jgi:lysine 2,3-aminomutase
VHEPDWRRLPAFQDVSRATWEDAGWQRRNTVRSVAGLRRVFGSSLDDDLAGDIAADQERMATMALALPPQVLNTMDERDLRGDPIRVYMAPALSDRDPWWPSHPFARRDSLGEAASFAVEGLVHRYPRKVMIELTTTCPQYCGHCTRMDLVGPSTPAVDKHRFATRRADRYAQILRYLDAHEEIHDVVVSGGDVANVAIAQLEKFVGALLDIPHIRSIRLASKSLVTLPQHFLQTEVSEALDRLAATARKREVDLALHTQANHANQLTPLVRRATTRLLELGLRDVRNQGVLLRGVNATPESVLMLCEGLLFGARITPYYLYVCDIIPGVEHWRTSIWEAQKLQRSLMGRLPGFAIPRVVCDVPLVGKRLVDQAESYDRERGISLWSRGQAAHTGCGDSERDHPYYDPIHTLPDAGRQWWIGRAAAPATRV